MSGQGCCCTNALQQPRSKLTRSRHAAVLTVHRHRPLNTTNKQKQAQHTLTQQGVAAQNMSHAGSATATHSPPPHTLYIQRRRGTVAPHRTYNLLLSLPGAPCMLLERTQLSSAQLPPHCMDTQRQHELSCTALGHNCRDHFKSILLYTLLPATHTQPHTLSILTPQSL
mgnify:CR=1 FL=1